MCCDRENRFVPFSIGLGIESCCVVDNLSCQEMFDGHRRVVDTLAKFENPKWRDQCVWQKSPSFFAATLETHHNKDSRKHNGKKKLAAWMNVPPTRDFLFASLQNLPHSRKFRHLKIQ